MYLTGVDEPSGVVIATALSGVVLRTYGCRHELAGVAVPAGDGSGRTNRQPPSTPKLVDAAVLVRYQSLYSVAMLHWASTAFVDRPLAFVAGVVDVAAVGTGVAQIHGPAWLDSSTGPPIASGNRSVGGICTRLSLPFSGAGWVGIEPVTSLGDNGWQPGYPEARAAAASLARVLAAVAPQRVVALSSIGGQRESGLGLITQVHMLEEALAALPIPTAILRPTWFMENSLWDIAPARETGTVASFLQPLDRAYSMVATADIGRVIAATLVQEWQGRRVIEIEGPQRYTQNEVASLLGDVLGRKVQAQAVPREQWEALFQSQGAAWPVPRIEMIDGFNSGWIEFEEAGVNERVIGETPYETVLAELAKRVS